MRVTSKINVNLRQPNTGARVDAVQNDVNTRALEISIFDGDDAWPVPEGVTAAVGFRKSDYKRGIYDKLPDGSAATQINGSVITVILAQQMLTAPGRVDACVILNDADLNQLTSFPFYVYVDASPAYGAQQSDDYIRLEWLEQKLDEYLQQIEGGSGTVDKTTVQKIVADYLAANPPTVTESDPTVPAWAKQPKKPAYTAEEVHALPDTYTPPDQTAQQVGADPAGTAATAVSQHNTDTAAHNDLRIALQELANRVNAALDSDDTTMDQLSEIVDYIKSNKTLIDAITTSKVSVLDIVNDLVTNVADKPLSAAQGVALKGLIEELRTLIPEAYTLPMATETTLGGVKPVTATEAMTQPVGVTDDGRLVTKPGEGSSSGGAAGGHWETIYEYVSDNIVVTDFSISQDEELGYVFTVPDGVLSEFNIGDTVILGIFPLDTISTYSKCYMTGQQYQIRPGYWTVLSETELIHKENLDFSEITSSNAVIEIIHGEPPKIFNDKIVFNPTSKLRYTGINTGGDIAGYTNMLFYNLWYMGNRNEGYLQVRSKHVNLIANLEIANGLLLFHHTVSADMLSSASAYNNKVTDRNVVGYIDAPASYMTDDKLTSIILGKNSGTPMFPRKGGFIRLEGWYE